MFSTIQDTLATDSAVGSSSHRCGTLEPHRKVRTVLNGLNSCPDPRTYDWCNGKLTLPVFHARGIVRTMCRNWEALIAANVYASAFNGHMPPVATCPITAEVAEMPRFIYKSFHLLLSKMMLDDQSDDTKVDGESVLARRVLPGELALNDTQRAAVDAGRRWRGVKPALALAARVIEEPVDIMEELFHQVF